MKLIETRYAPLMTSVLMIVVPLLLAFKGSAAQGTILEPLGGFATTLWEGFGVVSLIMGLVLLVWTIFAAWRAGELSGQTRAEG